MGSRGKIGAATIGIVTNGVLTRLLTKQEFGVYLLAFSIISLGAVIGSLGLPKTVLRFVAESMTRGRPDAQGGRSTRRWGSASWNGSGYQSAAMVLLSAGKLAAAWAESCGVVLKFTGHQRSMLRVNLLTNPLFIVGDC